GCRRATGRRACRLPARVAPVDRHQGGAARGGHAVISVGALPRWPRLAHRAWETALPSRLALARTRGRRWPGYRAVTSIVAPAGLDRPYGLDAPTANGDFLTVQVHRGAAVPR